MKTRLSIKQDNISILQMSFNDVSILEFSSHSLAITKFQISVKFKESVRTTTSLPANKMQMEMENTST